MGKALKLCECGKEGQTYWNIRTNEYIVRCHKGCERNTGYYKSKRKAIAAWNKRVVKENA